MKKQSFIGGIFLLTCGTLFAKLLGAFYRVPLTWVLGTEGLGIYQLVFPIFSLLLVISSTGAPTAISTMVAGRIKQNKYDEAKKIFKISLVSLLVVGLFSGIALFIFSSVLANLQGNGLSKYSYMAISFAIPLVSILSAFRGYYQGLQNMIPTALSQIIEQVGKLGFGLFLSYMLLPYGIEFGALGAVFGVVLGEVLAVIVLICYHIFVNRQHTLIAKDIPLHIINDSPIEPSELKGSIEINKTDSKALAKEMAKITYPIVLASFILPALQVFDSMVVVNLLTNIGYSATDATSMWGINSGIVNSIVNMPVVLSLAVATAVIPELSNIKAEISEEDRKRVITAHRYTLYIELPCLVGIAILAPWLLEFLYSDTLTTISGQMQLAVNLLFLSSFMIIFMGLSQVQNASLQGMGKSKVPLINIIISGIIKIVLLFYLVQMPSINIYGVTIANLVFYVLLFVLNGVYLRRKLNIRGCYANITPNIISCLMMAIILIMAHFAFVNYNVLISLPLSMLLGGITYLYTLCMLDKQIDFKLLVKNIISKVYRKKMRQ